MLGAFGALSEDEVPRDPVAVTMEELPGTTESGDVIRLVELGSVRGVGALVDDQDLGFAPDGLTVIYGPNAAGKSTYVRALKRVCRTVDFDAEVRGNVFAAEGEAPSPTARVEYIQGGERRAQQVDLSAPDITGLEALSVFDAPCAELYLNASNKVAYVPASLTVLARLASAQDSLRRDIAARAAELRCQRPAFPEVDTGTDARARVDALSASTDVDGFRIFAHLSETEHARLDELRAAVAAAAAPNPLGDAQAAEADAQQARVAAAEMRVLAGRVDAASVENLNAAAVDARTAKAAVERAAEVFGQLAVPGIGGDPWLLMWQAAREFVETGGESFPPPAGAPCPLCLQALTEDAGNRLAHFEGHVRSALQQHAVEAEQRLRKGLEGVQEAQIEAARTEFIAGLAEREPALHSAVESFLREVSDRMSRLRLDPGATAGGELSDPSNDLEVWAAARAQHAATLIAATDPAREANVRGELLELENRDRLASRVEDIVAWVATLRRVGALDSAYSGLATNRITSKQRELSQTAVTDVLDEALNQELVRLNCGHLPVDVNPRTAVGETQVALRLVGARGGPGVSEILSEGEQRALSLAFFFAEIGTAEHAGGIVVDDPVSSLDDERRAYIARRLAAEASRRQVVVFTHDLPFMLDLIEQAEQAGLEPLVQGVWRQGNAIGRVDSRPPFSALKLRQRVAVLTERVSKWDSEPQPRDADEAWRRVCDFYADMRTAWERAVEERLFRGVVQRFQRDVKTLKLRDVEVTEEFVTAIDDGMTRCSYFVHDAPAGTRTALPGRTVLAADLSALQDFERDSRDS